MDQWRKDARAGSSRTFIFVKGENANESLSAYESELGQVIFFGSVSHFDIANWANPMME